MPILNTPDVDLYYEISGTGEPILFIQGVGVIGTGWSPQTQELSKQFQTITFDNRGIGRSFLKSRDFSIEKMAQDAILLLDKLGLKSAHIVGHSMGGVIAQQIAIDHPTRVKSLALLCTFSKGAQALQLNSRIFWLGIRTRIGMRSMRRRAFLEMLYSQGYLSKHAALEALAHEVGQIVGRDLADSPAIIMKQLKALSRSDLSGQLNKISSIPTLIISGGEDPIARPEFGRDLAAKISGSEYFEWPQAAHGLVIEKSAQINQMLLAFSREKV